MLNRQETEPFHFNFPVSPGGQLMGDTVSLLGGSKKPSRQASETELTHAKNHKNQDGKK